jgi:hypothetical protein
MTLKLTYRTVIFCIAISAGLLALAQNATADTAKKNSVATPSEYILLTIFFKHDQSKTLTEIGEELKESKFWARFPPEGIEVDSWYVMMGIGQVVILRVPPNRLREVNIAVERTAWKAFRTEFYPTYDFKEVAGKFHKKALSQEKK